ncbi:MAG: hypothetical protein QM754_14030 [Tepidisphaeraceae bacterium]
MLMKYRLFTPGPTSVPEETLLQLARPVHHHRTAEFRKTFGEVQELLKYVFKTTENVYVITGSGTAAFEERVHQRSHAGPESAQRQQRQIRRGAGRATVKRSAWT